MPGIQHSPVTGHTPLHTDLNTGGSTEIPGLNKDGDQDEPCAHCGKKDEDSRSGALWIGCDTCQAWFHNACVGIKRKPAAGSTWDCARCKPILPPPNPQIPCPTGLISSIATEGAGTSVSSNHPDQNSQIAALEKQVAEAEAREKRREEVRAAEAAEKARQEREERDRLARKEESLKKQEKFRKNQDSDSSEDEIEELDRKVKEAEARALARQRAQKIAELKARLEELEVREREWEQRSEMKPNTSKLPPQQQSPPSQRPDDATQILQVFMQRQLELANQQAMMELPKFSGDPRDQKSIPYITWLQHFVKSQDEGKFSPAQNMMRLNNALQPPARNCVEDALALPDNVEAVIETLNCRYGNIDQLVQERMKRLGELAQPLDSRPDSIVQFFEFLLNMKASLTNVRATAYLSAPQTMDTIVRKLPPGTQTAWITHKRRVPSAGLDEFIQWYEPHYYAACTRMAAMPSPNKQRVNHHGDDNEPPKEGCPLCRRDNHKLSDCRRFAAKDLDGRWQVIKRCKWCSCCLNGRHWYKNCEQSKSCGLDGCEREHHQLLHKKKEAPKGPEGNPGAGQNHAHHQDAMKTFYRVVPVKLINEKKFVETWAFLDEGSGPTLMSKEIADKLELPIEPKELCLTWSDGSTRKVKSGLVEVKMQGISEKNQYNLKNVQTVPHLDLPTPRINLEELKTRYAHLGDVKIPEISSTKPEILIGLEHVKLMIPNQVREGSWNEPVATKTRLGWAVYGRARESNEIENYSCTIHECSNQEEKIEELIRNFQTTEAFGVTAPTIELRSLEDEKSLEIFSKTIKFQDGRYEVGLLWKDPKIQLPDNRAMALKRLNCFEQRLLKDPVLKEAVCEKIQDNLKKGYLEETSHEEVQSFPGRKWFLPIFAVKNPNKPGKIRIVYDAAAKCEGISLNDALMKGPDNLTPLLGVLFRFREGKFAVCGDIAEMFHRVKISPEDQFVQMVLWRDVNPEMPPKILKLAVMSFGATCSPSEAQHIKNYNALKFQKESPRAVQAIINRHYVDDYLDCSNSVPEIIKIVEDVKKIHAHGGFTIRNWISNSPEVIKAIDPGSLVKDEATLSLDMGEEQCSEKVLGMHWDVKQDCFVFKTSFVRVDPAVLKLERRPTKREVSSVVMSLFDPFGMLSTIVLPAKMLIQDLWRCGCDWDQPIPDEIYSAWRNWMAALENVEQVKVPRWLSPLLPQASEIQLHILCDASELAFCAVAYLRIKRDQEVDVTFVAAKTRVAPQKPLSIPRLELQGAVLASRLSTSIKTEFELKLDSVKFWTDSQTVLGWLRSSHRRYSAFVGHRVGEILDHTNLDSWKWVPGKENVADEGTKWEGCPTVSERWFAGPGFLLKEESDWPVEKNRVVTTAEEEKAIQFHAYHRRAQAGFDIIQPERFSSWNRLLRATAFVLRYVKNLREKTMNKEKKIPVLATPAEVKKAIKTIRELNGTELEAAQNLLIKKSQTDSYHDQMKDGLARKNSNIYNLNPYVDENGIIRVTTRLDAIPASVDERIKRPILLDGNHHITILMIEAAHKHFHHKNRETVVNELRQFLWIPKIRVFVNKVIKRCTLCAFLKAKPQVPRMAPLPKQRLQPFAPPFANTGIDYAGPFIVTVGRRREKRWIVVFTCLSMRAVHLEVASSLDTSSCVMAIRNFMNRRGCPVEILSDNGTNLKSGEKELKVLLQNINENEVMAKSQDSLPGANKIKWNFNPPTAAHFGGAWERIVRSVKDCLYMILKEKSPNDEIFRSAIIEVEATVNSRPLYYSPTEDINEPAITPNSILRLSLRDVLPQRPDELSSRKQWTRVQEIAHEFWSKWLKKYLPTIAIRTKWFNEENPLEIGQLVLIIDDSLRRGEWKRGIVQSVHPGRDGRIRSATVKTATGVFLRPVAKLAVIKGAFFKNELEAENF